MAGDVLIIDGQVCLWISGVLYDSNEAEICEVLQLSFTPDGAQQWRVTRPDGSVESFQGASEAHQAVERIAREHLRQQS